MLYLFVYGTLKRGQRNAGLLSDQTFVRTAVTEPLYRLYDCGSYPALVECPDSGVGIEGEVYRIDDAIRPTLDELEGVPFLYQLVRVRLQDCSETVWTYIYRQATVNLPDCGVRWPR